MNILVFGNSDTRGNVVPGPTWPEQVRLALQATTGDQVALVDRSFAPLGHRAPDVAERLAIEADAEIALLPLSEYAFWAPFVEGRVRQIFGRRAAGGFRAVRRRFERATKGRGGVRGVSHDWAQFVVRRVIGAAPLASVKEVTETYLETFRRLARIEHLEVVVVAYPLTPLPALASEKMRAARAGFLHDLRALASTHRFMWVDGDDVIARAGMTPTDAYAEDNVHIGQSAHDVIAAAIVELLAAGREGRP